MDYFYIWPKWSLSLEDVLCFLQKIWIFGKFLKFFGLDLENKSTVLDGFFPYLAQIIISIRGCVACNDLWPWPIFSRSFGLDLENRVRSVASTVLDGFFPYLVQMITSMRRRAAYHDLWPWPISSRSFDLVLTWGIQHDSIVSVIMRRRGVSSERRRSSYLLAFQAKRVLSLPASVHPTNPSVHPSMNFTLAAD